jgi:hypothetical protein
MTSDHESSPANAGAKQETVPARDASGRFLPGSSGNRAGGRRGSKHRSTVIAESVLGANAKQLLEHCIQVALGPKGGPNLRALLPYLAAPLKSRPITFELPEIRSAQDAVAAMDSLRHGLTNGALTPEEVVAMSKSIDTFVATLKVADLDIRIAALEQANKEQKK